MAYFGFNNKLLRGNTIQFYNYGNCRRDFWFTPEITLREGLRKFAEWYADYYGTKC